MLLDHTLCISMARSFSSLQLPSHCIQLRAGKCSGLHVRARGPSPSWVHNLLDFSLFMTLVFGCTGAAFSLLSSVYPHLCPYSLPVLRTRKSVSRFQCQREQQEWSVVPVGLTFTPSVNISLLGQAGADSFPYTDQSGSSPPRKCRQGEIQELCLKPP